MCKEKKKRFKSDCIIPLCICKSEGKGRRDIFYNHVGKPEASVYKGIQLWDDQRAWAQHIHQGFPWGQKLSHSTEANVDQKRENIYSRSGEEWYWKQVDRQGAMDYGCIHVLTLFCNIHKKQTNK